MQYLDAIPKPEGYIYLISPLDYKDPTIVNRVLDTMMVSYVTAMSYVKDYPVFPATFMSSMPQAYGYQTDWVLLSYPLLKTCSEVWVLMINDWQEDENVSRAITYAQELGKPIRHLYYSEKENNLMFLDTADVFN